MKTILIALLLTSLSFAQSLANFTNEPLVNDALVKAQAAINGSGVANQLTYWTGVATVGSLATATYPSLVELARVKGVTSPIQTQLNGKQSTLVSGTHIKTLNGQSLLGAGNITILADTTGLWLKIYNEVKAQLIGATLIGTAATLDSMIIDFRKNNYIRNITK